MNGRKLLLVPASVRIDPTRRRVDVVASGILTGEELYASQKEIASSPGFEPSFDALYDLTAVSSVQMLSTAKVRAAADRSVFAPQARRAFVANDPVVFGLMRMFGSFLGERGGEIEMFEDRATAERWLDRQ